MGKSHRNRTTRDLEGYRLDDTRKSDRNRTTRDLEGYRLNDARNSDRNLRPTLDLATRILEIMDPDRLTLRETIENKSQRLEEFRNRLPQSERPKLRWDKDDKSQGTKKRPKSSPGLKKGKEKKKKKERDRDNGKS